MSGPLTSTVYPPEALRRRDLRLVRGLYFFFYAGFGLMITYLNVYYREVWLSGTQIGVLNATTALVVAVSGPMWGMISDRFGSNRALIVTTTGAIIGGVWFITADGFLPLIAATLWYSFFTQPLNTLLAGVTMHLLHDEPERFSRQRIWGSLSFIIFTWTFGQVFNQTGLGAMFYVYMAMLGVMLAIVFFLSPQHSKLKTPLREGLGRLIRQRDWAVFMASLFILNIGVAGMNVFLSVYVRDLGGDQGLIGAVSSLQSISELPVLFLGAYLLQRFGARKLLLVGYGLYAVRWLLYGIMATPEWAIPIALLHSLTFGAQLIGAVAYANELAPPELKATTQGFYFTSMALARTIFSPISGALYDRIGPGLLFQLYALLGVFALGLLWWGIRRRNAAQIM